MYTTVSYGVSQGYVFGPILFILYMLLLVMWTTQPWWVKMRQIKLITGDPDQLLYCFFRLLPSGRGLWSLRARTNILKDSFTHQSFQEAQFPPYSAPCASSAVSTLILLTLTPHPGINFWTGHFAQRWTAQSEPQPLPMLYRHFFSALHFLLMCL